MEGAKTALYDRHVELGAKMVPFAGYIMPIQYDSITAEHKAVRESVGVFDVSHMGEFIVKGPDAEAFLNRMTVNNLGKLHVNQAQYTAMLFDGGGIVDDLLIYKYEDHYMLVVNAANLSKDFEWLQTHLSEKVTLEDRSNEFSLIAVQGRNAQKTLQKLTDQNLDEIKFYWFREGKIDGNPCTISRTGYTGEDGFELYMENEHAPAIWDAVMEAGREFDIKPAGLGARDTLRLEMKLALYGNDIDETTNPIEAGLGWITKTGKGEFVGRSAVLDVKEKGIKRKLVGFEVEGKAIPRKGYECRQGGEKIGEVTSGAWSPSLDKGIGMAYLDKEYSTVGTRFEVVIRNKTVPAVVVETPFYKRPY